MKKILFVILFIVSCGSIDYDSKRENKSEEPQDESYEFFSRNKTCPQNRNIALKDGKCRMFVWKNNNPRTTLDVIRPAKTWGQCVDMGTAFAKQQRSSLINTSNAAQKLFCIRYL